MRGIGLTFSRLPAARVFIAGAAILAGASASKAYSQHTAGSDETAMAIPRVAPRGGASVPLPQPLPPAQAALIRRIFALQRSGDVQAAARASDGIDLSFETNGVRLGQAMLGHVLADRYLGRFTKPGADQLTAWLAAYGDLPYAPAVRALLIARLPRGSKPPPALALAALGTEISPPAPVPEESEPAALSLHRSRLPGSICLGGGAQRQGGCGGTVDPAHAGVVIRLRVAVARGSGADPVHAQPRRRGVRRRRRRRGNVWPRFP